MALLDDLGDLSAGLSNPFGAPSRGEWNLAEGSFINSAGTKCVFFFEKPNKPNPLTGIIRTLGVGSGGISEDRSKLTNLEQISDGGGRRVAEYNYPYLDGRATEDLGRMGETFSFNIKFTGTNYQSKFKEFLSVVANVKGSGTLSHPVRGTVRAQFQTWEFVHRYDEWSSVTIKATFLEDNTGKIAGNNLVAASPNSALRSALQGLTAIQSSLQQTIFAASALLLLPSAVVNAMQQRVSSITGATSRLLGQLAVTFSTDAKLQSLFAQASTTSGGVTTLSSGTVAGTSSQAQSSLPPVYQVGFSPADQQTILSQVSAFISSNQVTTQQAVFACNQIRVSISEALAEIDVNLGNDGFDAVVQYRSLAVLIQQATESSVASTQALVKLYTVPQAMSLRMVAFNNGLDSDRQNDIEALNPYIGSVNYVQAGTLLVVPAA